MKKKEIEEQVTAIRALDAEIAGLLELLVSLKCQRASSAIALDLMLAGHK